MWLFLLLNRHRTYGAFVENWCFKQFLCTSYPQQKRIPWGTVREGQPPRSPIDGSDQMISPASFSEAHLPYIQESLSPAIEFRLVLPQFVHQLFNAAEDGMVDHCGPSAQILMDENVFGG